MSSHIFVWVLFLYSVWVQNLFFFLFLFLKSKLKRYTITAFLHIPYPHIHPIYSNDRKKKNCIMEISNSVCSFSFSFDVESMVIYCNVHIHLKPNEKRFSLKMFSLLSKKKNRENNQQTVIETNFVTTTEYLSFEWRDRGKENKRQLRWRWLTMMMTKIGKERDKTHGKMK